MTRLDEAIRKLDRGEFREGQRILESPRHEQPDNPMVLYNLGLCYSEQGKLKASIEALQTCVAGSCLHERLRYIELLLRTQRADGEGCGGTGESEGV